MPNVCKKEEFICVIRVRSHYLMAHMAKKNDMVMTWYELQAQVEGTIDREVKSLTAIQLVENERVISSSFLRHSSTILVI